MTHQPFFMPSLLISVLAIPLVFGLIPRNHWYGIRTAQTLSDETRGIAPIDLADARFCFRA
jgi:hypothetical protein